MSVILSAMMADYGLSFDHPGPSNGVVPIFNTKSNFFKQTVPLSHEVDTYDVTRDNAKLECHCTARYKIEWIYMRTKVSSPDSLELVLEMKKKERLTICTFFQKIKGAGSGVPDCFHGCFGA